MCASTTGAAIVAGGAASRFGGQDKSRLVVDGRTIIVRQVEVLQRVASEVFVVAPHPGRFSDQPVTVIPDRRPGCGALGGIDAALYATTCEQMIVIACDLPFLTAELLARLAVLGRTRDGAWVRTGRGVEPLVACYRTAARERISAFLDAGGRRAADLGSFLDLADLAPPELDRYGPPSRLLANVNTPDDYARVQYGLA